jgi:hypothetical protein
MTKDENILVIEDFMNEFGWNKHPGAVGTSSHGPGIGSGPGAHPSEVGSIKQGSHPG